MHNLSVAQFIRQRCPAYLLPDNPGVTIGIMKIRQLLPKRLQPKSAKVSKFPRQLKYFIIAFLLIIVSLFVYYIQELPSPSRLRSHEFPVSTQIMDRHGNLLYEIYADTQRNPIPLETIPPHIIHATLAIEDQDFYRHFGFSIQGIVRASKNTLFKNKLQGGSTITQQLVKTALLTPERTLERKLKEAILTLETEIIYTKDEILEMYLNHIPYGGTAYGIEAAAKRYFNKSTTSLTLAEATLLAGLPQAPTRYSPFFNPESAKARQQEVLRRMVEDGYISQEEADQAAATKLTFAPPATDIKAPHFVFYIKDLLEQKYGLQKVEQGGLRVYTSLDLSLQEYAQSSVSAEIDTLKNFRVGNGAALVTDPRTGEILAMIGSVNYFDSDNDGQVNLTNRLRQPGSSIKPINYVTGLQTKKITPSSMLLDMPTCFRVTGQTPYCPRNYDGGFHGPVQIRYALANSYNIPAVKVLAINSLESMIATASAMGISTFKDPARYGLSLTLGGGEVTMLDMAKAFGTLANLGVRTDFQPILKITDYQGNVLEEFDREAALSQLTFYFDEEQEDSNLLGVVKHHFTRVLNREPAWLMKHILADNPARAAAFGTRSELFIPNRVVSVKTGTTNDLRDNWTIGYTDQFVVVTWVGNNDNSPMNPRVVSGVTGAAPIWNDIMTHLLRDHPDTNFFDLKPPQGVIGTNVCRLSGVFPKEGEACDLRFEYFWETALPRAETFVRKNIWVNKHTGRPAFTSDAQLDADQDQPLDDLELREHLIVSDPFTQEFCLDCQTFSEDGEPIRPAATTVDMSSFYLQL
jgi:penicillin-binding protein 1C